MAKHKHPVQHVPVVQTAGGEKVPLHTPIKDTVLNEPLLAKLAGFQPASTVYGGETTAAHEFLGEMERFIVMLGNSGRLKLLKTPADVVNLLITQLPLRTALAKLLFKRATGVEGGTVIIIFNLLPDDYSALILTALITEGVVKSLSDEFKPDGKLPRFKVVFEASKKPPKEENKPNPAQAGTPAKS